MLLAEVGVQSFRSVFFFRNSNDVRMLTLASTTKVSTGSSMLARTQQFSRIQRRIASSAGPGLDRVPFGRTMPIRPPGLTHSTDRWMNNCSGDIAGGLPPVLGSRAPVSRFRVHDWARPPRY